MTHDIHKFRSKLWVGISAYAFQATVLSFLMLFGVSACSTLNSNEKPINSTNNHTVSSKQSSNAVSSREIASKAASKPTIDQTVDQWQNARAEYLRDLDYAKISRQNNSKSEYRLKSKLIETRYDIRSAKTALYEENNLAKARKELLLANQRLEQAIQLANPDVAIYLKSTKKHLNKLLKTDQLCRDRDCDTYYANPYHDIEANLEKLLIKL